MGSLSMGQVNEDIRFLIQMGDYYEVLSNDTICVSGQEANPISVNGNTIKILSAVMKTPEIGEDIALLNPFKQVQVNTVVLSKFYRILTYVPGRMIHAIMERTIALHEKNEDCTIDEIAWLSKFKGEKANLIDDKTLAEFHKVLTQSGKAKTNQLLSIKYDRNAEKTIIKSDFVKDVEGYNIRKKTKRLLLAIFEELLGDDLSEFSHVPTTLINRQSESMMTTIHNVYERLGDVPKVMLSVTVDLKKLREIISNLEKYTKFTNHIVDISVADVEETPISETEPSTPADIRSKLTLGNIPRAEELPVGQKLTLPQPIGQPVYHQPYASPVVYPTPMQQYGAPTTMQPNMPFVTPRLALQHEVQQAPSPFIQNNARPVY